MMFDNLWKACGLHFEELISDVQITPCPTDNPIIAGRPHPFNNHLYLAFLVKDDADASAEQIISDYFVPTAKALAQVMKRFQMVEAQELPTPKIVDPETGREVATGLLQKTVWAGGLPLRFSANYDIVEQATRFTVDMLVRHIGNHYRTIINGPLHRHQMPFKNEPPEQFEYIYIPVDRPNYYQPVFDEEGNTIDEELLPGLDRSCMWQEYRHLYRVKGDYCYYRGESVL